MRQQLGLYLPVLAYFLATPLLGQEVADDWKYTLRKPAGDWHSTYFNDATWKEASAGFGTQNTPGARVGTIWATNNIWLRKSFELKSIPDNPALLIHHDEDAEVYLNGTLVAAVSGYTTKYTVLRFDNAKHTALRTGDNLLAVHCRQTSGGQFIDVHVVDEDNLPKLPAPKRNRSPFISDLITKWGALVTANNAWREYPRPQLKRNNWLNLNGHWDYAITPISAKDAPSNWAGTILVPFCLESKLSGVQRLLDPTEALWYRRTFTVAIAEGTRTLLNFEAVDYRCEVFVNGQLVGSHQGGNTPFALDISSAVRNGSNELTVRVEDGTEAWQLRGKQTLNPRGIWYTQVSGIWQSVWLEQVSSSYVSELKVATNAETGSISVTPIVAGTNRPMVHRVVVKRGDEIVAQSESDRSTTELRVDNAKLWSPKTPHLYTIEVAMLDDRGIEIDRVQSYAGIRSVGKAQDVDGHWRFTLNGDQVFSLGPLDQGWWPDGLLTPPSDAAMLFEIEWLKDAGFNMIRKHIKIEPRRYYYHCDRLGIMVWQDHVSGGEKPPWTRLKPNPVDADWPAFQHKQFMAELERMVSTLENHPSIVSWVPFNESWGQHRTMQVGEWLVKRDPSRLVNIASGGNFWPVGDVVDAHSYPHPDFPFLQGEGRRFDTYIHVMGEFGGHGYPVEGHLWDANRRNWGYGDLPISLAEYKARYAKSLHMLNQLRRQGIAAGVYTQTTDVEGEINGLMTYDRKVIKISAKELSELHRALLP